MNLIKYLFLFIMLLSAPAYAQAKSGTDTGVQSSLFNAPPTAEDTVAADTPKGKQMATTSDATAINPFGSFEFILSLAVLFFGMVVVSFEVYLASKKIIKSDHIFKCIIITLVIIGSVLLVTAGYSNNQITGVLGILGSISGYLIGKMDATSGKPEGASAKEKSSSPDKTESDEK